MSRSGQLEKKTLAIRSQKGQIVKFHAFHKLINFSQISSSKLIFYTNWPTYLLIDQLFTILKE